MIPGLYLRIAAYGLAALLCGYGGWAINGSRWSARYETLQASDAQARAEGEAAVRKALEAQLVQAQAVSSNNASVIQRLQNEKDQIAADHDVTLNRVRRLEQLLVLAARQAPTGTDVPQASGGPEPLGTRGNPGASEIEQLLVDAKEESERNAARLNALIAQIKPQL